jgi:oligo-1,6-glucosidase
MQWLPEYMSSAKSWLPMHPNYKIKNVQNQLNEMNSHLNVFIDLVKLRKHASTLQWGALNFVKVEEKILSFTRTAYDFPTYLIVMNFSEENINTNLLVGTDIAPRAYVALYIPGKSSDETHAYEKGEPVLTKNVSLKAYDCLILTWHSTN